MMQLSMMRDFLESENHNSFIYQVLEKWGYVPGSIKFIRASSNFVYSFENNKEKFILRITPNGNINRITGELSFLEYLSKNNISVNVPIESRDGNKIETFENPLGSFYAVVFNFLSGVQYDIEELKSQQYYLWGKALGSTHHMSKQFSSNVVGEENHMTLLFKKLERNMPTGEIEARTELETLKTWIYSLDKTSDNYGFLHSDFELDNLLWKDEQIQILDFESYLVGWYVTDLAFALRDLFSQKVDLSNKFFRLFIEGYREKNMISEQEVNQIPMFLRIVNLFTFSKLINTLDIPSDSLHPEWVEGLNEKLMGKLEDYRRGFKSLNI